MSEPAEKLDQAARALHRHLVELEDEVEKTRAALRDVIAERGKIERPKYLTAKGDPEV